MWLESVGDDEHGIASTSSRSSPSFCGNIAPGQWLASALHIIQ
jgi:hypothetical protein